MSTLQEAEPVCRISKSRYVFDHQNNAVVLVNRTASKTSPELAKSQARADFSNICPCCPFFSTCAPRVDAEIGRTASYPMLVTRLQDPEWNKKARQLPFR